MAFVSRSERIIKFAENEQFDAGPGTYLGAKPNLPKPRGKAPFNSTTLRDTSLQPENHNPGPGSYDFDEKFAQFPNIFHKRKKNSYSLYKAMEVNFKNLGGNTSSALGKEFKPLGFLSNEQRFMPVIKSGCPGPGQYEHVEKSVIKSENEKERVSHISSVNIRGSPHRIVSIPTKDQAFGYECQNDEALVMIDDPDKEAKFKGTKEDSVGPGRYNITGKWAKNVIDWGKMRCEKASSIKNDNPNTTTAFQSVGNNSSSGDGAYSGITLSSTKIISEKKRTQKDKNAMFKHIMNQRKYLLNLQSLKCSENQLENDILKDLPGPGYYYSDLEQLERKKRLKPEKFQTFGSSAQRFINGNAYTFENGNSLGPGQYFIDDTNAPIKRKKVHILQPIRSGSEGKQDVSSLKEDIDGLIGPGYYDPKSPGKNISSTVSHFGSLTKRFVEDKKANARSPGPGAYLSQPIWKPPIQSTKIGSFLSREEPFLKQIVKEKLEIPPVGAYNPDIVHSIRYRVAAKASQFQNSNAPFTSMEKRFGRRSIGSFTVNNKLGPGYYYKESKLNATQQNPPFKTGDRREYSKPPANDVGPGNYNYMSYFDWNKKSHNILFI